METNTLNSKSLFNKIDEDYSPRDLIQVAEALNASIYEDDLADEVSGYIIRAKTNGTAYIVVNKNHPVSRKRFTIAHELGHLMAHSDGKPFRADRTQNKIAPKSDEELAADKFAASLLMPKDDIEMLLRLDATIPFITKRLQVSRTALIQRIIDLENERSENER